MGKVVIMRAIPGAGKSTYVKGILTPEAVKAGAVWASADHFFLDRDGRYNFDIKKIGLAHNHCKNVFSDAIHQGVPLVIVDNTNIKVRDFKNYVSEAKAHGYEVEIVRLECDPAVAAKRNVHNVPVDVIERMYRDLKASVLPDDYPKETVIKTDESVITN